MHLIPVEDSKSTVCSRCGRAFASQSRRKRHQEKAPVTAAQAAQQGDPRVHLPWYSGPPQLFNPGDVPCIIAPVHT